MVSPVRYPILFTRTAILDIRSLPSSWHRNVQESIASLRQGERHLNRQLEGYQGLWRTRKGDIRVVWKYAAGGILVLRADLRRDVYQDIPEDEDQVEAQSVAQVLGIAEEAVDAIPTYQEPPAGDGWHRFIYGGYLFSPVLTPEQQQVFTSQDGWAGEGQVECFLVQASPGTGKTVCAAVSACEMHDQGWDVALVLPENLCEDVKQFDRVRELLAQQSSAFFLGTLRQWAVRQDPGLEKYLARPQEEKAALEYLAQRVRKPPKLGSISDHDLILYQNFVDGHPPTPIDHPNYWEHQARITALRNLQPRQWRQALGPKIPWLDAWDRLTRTLEPDPASWGTWLVMDEAQDYLLAEIKGLAQMFRRWRQQHPVTFCLLGDLNQRVRPVNFDWGQLELGRRATLRFNYRNTREILRFANLFYDLAAQCNRRHDGRSRHLPPPCDPESAFQRGDPVRLLEVRGPAEAADFLGVLQARCGDEGVPDERYLLHRLADRVRLIYASLPPDHQPSDHIEYLDLKLAGEQIKGREFSACIAFCILGETDSLSYAQANNLYMVFTRPRYRLLVVATTDQIDRLGRGKLAGVCEFQTDGYGELVDWVRRQSSSECSSQDAELVFALVERGLTMTPPWLYADTYTALQLARAPGEQINALEQKMMATLQDPDWLEAQLSWVQEIDDQLARVPLVCLLLRALGCSWAAREAARELLPGHHQEYERLLDAIAQDLRRKGLPYEAARLRGDSLDTYPFGDSVAGQSGPLVSLLCRGAIQQLSLGRP